MATQEQKPLRQNNGKLLPKKPPKPDGTKNNLTLSVFPATNEEVKTDMGNFNAFYYIEK